MPLEHSNSPGAFKRNVATLMHEVGKSPHVQSRAQALAIAYANQRRNRADGGVAPATFNERFEPFYDFGPYYDAPGGGGGSTWLPGATLKLGTPHNYSGRRSSETAVARHGGVVPGFDAGGTVDPVQAVIAALNQGSAGAAPGVVAAPATGTSQASQTAQAGRQAASVPAAPTQPVAFVPTTSPGVVPAPQNAVGPNFLSTPTAATPVLSTPAGIAPPVPAPPAPASPASFAAAPASAPTTALVAPAPANPAGFAPIAQPLMSTGGALHRASGGFNMAQGPNLQVPWFERQEARGLHVGPVLSAVPGRTDNHQIKVPGGSYVLPAAHLASMGQGNSIAGMSLASKMFSGPYGAGAPKIGGGHGTMPRPPRPMTQYASGGIAPGAYSEGGARGEHDPVDVNVSGGEFIIPPWAIIDRFGSLKKGHAVLDKWVLNTRAEEIKTQKRLPPPAKK